MDDHIHILRCPLTYSSLTILAGDELRRVNSAIRQRQLRHYNGTLVQDELETGLISADGQFIYPIKQEIIILLADLAIVATTTPPKTSSQHGLRHEKQAVATFYDQIGWQKATDTLFTDTVLFGELRPVTHDYTHKCHLRVAHHLPLQGTYLLDVASGPIPLPEYLHYSDNFTLRVCVDLSFVALQGARQQLGTRGLYILADITRLPLADGTMDAVISLHTVYHVPADEQHTAVCELYRVLQPNASAVIVYCWGRHSPVINLTLFPHHTFTLLWRMASHLGKFALRSFNSRDELVRRKLSGALKPRLYFHAHDYQWFTRQPWAFPYRILVWSSINLLFLRVYIHDWLGGKQLLALLYWLEETFPYLAGRWGYYPMIVLHKPGPNTLQETSAA